jgi:hypothetical protein
MKLVAATAAAMATVSMVKADGHADHGDDHDMMVPEMEQPWYQFMLDSGNLQIDENKMLFKTEDPKIYILNQHDGMKRNIKTPWFNQKYEIKNKMDNENLPRTFEFEAKESVPAWGLINKAYMKMGEFPKNSKSLDPNCTNNNPKKCEIKTQIGVQKKSEVEMSHETKTGKMGMFQKEKLEVDLDMKPTKFDLENGWSYKVHDGVKHLHEQSEMLLMMPKWVQDAMGVTDEDREKMHAFVEMELPEDREMMVLEGKCNNKISHSWEYEMVESPLTGDMMDHWTASEWSIKMDKMMTDYETFEDSNENFQVAGSAYWNREESTTDVETMSANMVIDYNQQANTGWSDMGKHTVSLTHVDNCMALMNFVMEGDWESFFYGSFGERPCVLKSMIEGQSTHMDEAGEPMLTPYKMGAQWSITDLFNWDISVFDAEADMLMPYFAISRWNNELDQQLTKIECSGNDLITVNKELHEAAWYNKMDM